jgi:pimeloyl-ACP methyl ester carboxylesterase
VRAPVLAVHGEHGAPHHRQAMHFLADLLTDCRVVELAGSHHLGPNSHPNEVAELVVGFARACGWPPLGG